MHWVLIISIFLLLGFLLLQILKRNAENKPKKKSEIVVVDKHIDNSQNKGEKLVSQMLSDIIKTYNGYLFNNFTFIDDNGFSTNIDQIFLSRGGLFIIETKSNIGTIYGNDSYEVWEARIKGRKSNKLFKNPIKQNKKHINHLLFMLKNNSLKMNSMIIFPLADSIYNVVSGFVYDLCSAKKFIIDKTKEERYSKEVIDEMYFRLNEVKNIHGISLEEHRVNIKNKYKK